MSDHRQQYSDDARLYRFLQIEGFYADKALEYVMAGLSIEDATLMANNLKCAAHKNAEMSGLCTPIQKVLFKARPCPNASPAPSPPSSPPPTPRKGAVFDSAVIKCGPLKASQPPPSPPPTQSSIFVSVKSPEDEGISPLSKVLCILFLYFSF